MSGAILDRRRWGRALPVCAALIVLVVLVVLAALGAPVRLPEAGAARDPSDVLPEEVAEAVPEDFGAFLASRRWGVSLNELREASAPPAEPSEPEERTVNPVLVEMGYVGLIAANGRSAVLLASPEGGVLRMEPGDLLPDGRTLVAVDDNRLILKGEGQPAEVLTLFPRARTGSFDVHIDGNRVTYVKDPCVPADTEDTFFLHVIPADVDDLPEERRQYGFDNLDFSFESRGVMRDGACRASVDLPEYAFTRVRTGQYHPERDRSWTDELPFWLWAENLPLQEVE